MKMKCPKGVTSVSFNGETFEASKKGIVEVPHTALTALSELGLVAVPDAPPAKAGEGDGESADEGQNADEVAEEGDEAGEEGAQ
jgi:hypothetical protein